MKYLFIITALVGAFLVSAQQPKAAAAKSAPLPAGVYKGLADSCTAVDITFFTSTASMSLDNRNVRFLAAFVSQYPTAKNPKLPQDGIIMWTRNGSEYITGKMYFSGDSTGYLTFDKNNREYINALTAQGAAFLQSHGKKK
ncbi:MAG: hypothetical protein JWO03_29 [Bacteroidetes bacterium]|nr:hypothetical protein [Bacteroidota bacterium]